ncbi:MAG: hypothetical protein A2268_14210 [Candidatus Raymondbacteria bacterium RifOxyA12_full_50_37]|uniref:Recombinase RmuC n=1 Tax=Candidatus Raymondbacteria bacterium RIFOXYD12_FULL_49_13 TaxID=1817890 RepID=A0A1F7FKW9_UNCRA|nr:MAG: hypothetical protein A2268_14210 [Candidatus Raymondbacteria bacterium RifOxyA12_full_50_37]OGJ86913.1 MAG: hypothetical protein A2350_02120 [Candidatus Raymondbacteria bacterium RifOxyB12_full_50_8]OGJ88233.1 MAG: hypothetical protein A2248_19550 [Candidatus Raymondbacteria bacterium RIFOXYA2_FULL_49_16]OGK07278.1 MAG: hypothetical protein A2519_14220 [Candidatus Raymondbacteria bacterium RIFOXYD12_FULL_49_13]OGP41047.1 MAG: hypothetical protein A2324_06175 [Candidatus Raymondbacteria 
MNPLLIVVIVLAVFVCVLAIVVFVRRPRTDATSMLMLQQQFDALKTQIGENSQNSGRFFTESMLKLQDSIGTNLKTITESIGVRLGESRESMDNTNKRLDVAAKYMQELERRLGMLGEKTDQLSAIGKDLNQLSALFQSPKLRGNISEMWLGNLLKEVLPDAHYTLQYQFKTAGTQVDAVVRIEGRLVPIDAKFPYENFKRFSSAEIPEADKAKLRKEFMNDVKKHIDAIAEKYIRPDEGTYDFALMYIPAEAVYYEIIIRDEKMADGNSLLDYANRKRVIPVSPNSFYAYLQVIIFGLKGLEIEKSAEQMREWLKRVQVDFGKFFDNFTKVGTKIDAAKKEYDDAAKRFDLLNQRMGRITGQDAFLSGDQEPPPPGSLLL